MTSACDAALLKDSIAQKLCLANGTIQLPNPDTISQWEVDLANIPTVDGDCIEAYFNNVNREFSIQAKECKALRLGKGLSISGHVIDLKYSGINTLSPCGFVKSKQTN